MEPAGRQVGVILRRIRNKDQSKPGDRSATETKRSERADKIHRGVTERRSGHDSLHRGAPALLFGLCAVETTLRIIPEKDED